MQVRNFCIIAHIDHGKSTLADRFLEVTKTVESREMKEQLLDSMDLEREKGITIKLQPVRMLWRPAGADADYILNLIDTPGHVDFQYEVSRSLQAVEGAILLVDATQGVQAQTLSNLYLAIEQGLTIIPVLNKIDLAAADVDKVSQEIRHILGEDEVDILQVSAKTGAGVEDLLKQVIDKVPAPTKSKEEALRCLIFDSVYDDYKGIVAYVRVFGGEVRAGDELKMIGTGAQDRAVEVGVFAPDYRRAKSLRSGEIGYIASGLKDIREVRVGDTVTLNKAARPAYAKASAGKQERLETEALPGFKIPQPKVFAGIFPKEGGAFDRLRSAMEKLQLNDASLTVRQENNQALGQGYRCGFLGMLHLEIIQQRLQREYRVEAVVTVPSVQYLGKLTDGKTMTIHTPAEFPDPSRLEKVEERWARTEIIVPSQDLGAVFELLRAREGQQVKQDYLGQDRVLLEYLLPLRELVVDLYDQLKSVTSGYGSMSYELADWREADVVVLRVLVNGEAVEALSVVVPRSKAEREGRGLVQRLKEVLPRQMFAVPLQAAVGGSIVARETLPAMRKNVTGHLYGGDVTRKRKLLEKQKKGKKKLAAAGSVDIPAEAYLRVLKR